MSSSMISLLFGLLLGVDLAWSLSLNSARFSNDGTRIDFVFDRQIEPLNQHQMSPADLCSTMFQQKNLPSDVDITGAQCFIGATSPIEGTTGATFSLLLSNARLIDVNDFMSTWSLRVGKTIAPVSGDISSSTKLSADVQAPQNPANPRAIISGFDQIGICSRAKFDAISSYWKGPQSLTYSWTLTDTTNNSNTNIDTAPFVKYDGAALHFQTENLDDSVNIEQLKLALTVTTAFGTHHTATLFISNQQKIIPSIDLSRIPTSWSHDKELNLALSTYMNFNEKCVNDHLGRNVFPLSQNIEFLFDWVFTPSLSSQAIIGPESENEFSNSLLVPPFTFASNTTFSAQVTARPKYLPNLVDIQPVATTFEIYFSGEPLQVDLTGGNREWNLESLAVVVLDADKSCDPSAATNEGECPKTGLTFAWTCHRLLPSAASCGAFDSSSIDKSESSLVLTESLFEADSLYEFTITVSHPSSGKSESKSAQISTVRSKSSPELSISTNLNSNTEELKWDDRASKLRLAGVVSKSGTADSSDIGTQYEWRIFRHTGSSAPLLTGPDSANSDTEEIALQSKTISNGDTFVASGDQFASFGTYIAYFRVTVLDEDVDSYSMWSAFVFRVTLATNLIYHLRSLPPSNLMLWNNTLNFANQEYVSLALIADDCSARFSYSISGSDFDTTAFRSLGESPTCRMDHNIVGVGQVLPQACIECECLTSSDAVEVTFDSSTISDTKTLHSVLAHVLDMLNGTRNSQQLSQLVGLQAQPGSQSVVGNVPNDNIHSFLTVTNLLRVAKNLVSDSSSYQQLVCPLHDTILEGVAELSSSWNSVGALSGNQTRVVTYIQETLSESCSSRDDQSSIEVRINALQELFDAYAVRENSAPQECHVFTSLNSQYQSVLSRLGTDSISGEVVTLESSERVELQSIAQSSKSDSHSEDRFVHFNLSETNMTVQIASQLSDFSASVKFYNSPFMRDCIVATEGESGSLRRVLLSQTFDGSINPEVAESNPLVSTNSDENPSYLLVIGTFNILLDVNDSESEETENNLLVNFTVNVPQSFLSVDTLDSNLYGYELRCLARVDEEYDGSGCISTYDEEAIDENGEVTLYCSCQRDPNTSDNWFGMGKLISLDAVSELNVWIVNALAILIVLFFALLCYTSILIPLCDEMRKTTISLDIRTYISIVCIAELAFLVAILLRYVLDDDHSKSSARFYREGRLASNILHWFALSLCMYAWLRVACKVQKKERLLTRLHQLLILFNLSQIAVYGIFMVIEHNILSIERVVNVGTALLLSFCVLVFFVYALRMVNVIAHFGDLSEQSMNRGTDQRLFWTCIGLACAVMCIALFSVIAEWADDAYSHWFVFASRWLEWTILVSIYLMYRTESALYHRYGEIWRMLEGGALQARTLEGGGRAALLRPFDSQSKPEPSRSLFSWREDTENSQMQNTARPRTRTHTQEPSRVYRLRDEDDPVLPPDEDEPSILETSDHSSSENDTSSCPNSPLSSPLAFKSETDMSRSAPTTATAATSAAPPASTATTHTDAPVPLPVPAPAHSPAQPAQPQVSEPEHVQPQPEPEREREPQTQAQTTEEQPDQGSNYHLNSAVFNIFSGGSTSM